MVPRASYSLGFWGYPATQRAGRSLATAHVRKPFHPERRQHPYPAEDPGPFQLSHDHALCAPGSGSFAGCIALRAALIAITKVFH